VIDVNWLSLVALTACLVLAVAAYRGQRVGVRKSLVLALAWGGIFLLVAAVFAAVGPQQSL
jgi:hypothetical protein